MLLTNLEYIDYENLLHFRLIAIVEIAIIVNRLCFASFLKNFGYFTPDFGFNWLNYRLISKLD